jgi:hypothetical protein
MNSDSFNRSFSNLAMNHDIMLSLIKTLFMNLRVCLIFCFSILMIGCNPPVPSTKSPARPDKVSIQTDSIANAHRISDVQDSLWLKQLEAEALEKVSSVKSIKTTRFKSDSFHFEKGNLVCPDLTHLLLYLHNRDDYFGEYSVWEYQGDSLAQLLKMGSGNTTQGVLFKDVNGDGYQDFLMEGYATTGSGEKYFNEVYLYNPRSHTFDYIDGLGMNPHFYPLKGIVTCYYNPGTKFSAEKYRLNWNQLELLEEVELQLRGMIEGTEKMDCVRKIYRFRKGEKYLFRKDRGCDFPPEYKHYEELVPPETNQ